MRFLLLTVSFAAIAGNAFAQRIDWPQPGLNAAHSGYNAAETTISTKSVDSLSQKWVVSIPNGIQSAPIELGGLEYVQSTSPGIVYAISSSGKIVWTYTAGTPAGTQGVVAGGNLVYAPCNVDQSGHGGICALNAATGALVWSFAVITVQGQTVTSSYATNVPVVDHGKIFFAYTYGGFNSPYSGNVVYALDAVTGAQVWGISETTGDKSGGLPFAVAHGLVFYQTGGAGTYICAVKEADGSAGYCSASLGPGSYAAVSISGSDVLSQNVDANGNTVFTALHDSTLSTAWQKTVTGITSNYSLFPPASANGLGYFYAGQNGFGSLYALSLATGQQRWTYACSGAAACLNSGVSVANGVLFASCDREAQPQGDQCAFNARTGALLRLYGSTDGNSGSIATPLVANGAEIAACGAYSGALCKFAP